MTVTYSTNLGFTKPDLDHRDWHLDVNTSIDLIEEAISGIFVKEITEDDSILITDGVTTDGRHALIEFTGEVTPPATITVPNVEKFWIFLNNTDQILTIDNGTGGTIQIAIGTYCLVYNDGTDVFKIFEILADSPELSVVAGILSDKSFKEQFDTFDLSLWTQFQSLVGTTAIITAGDGANRKSAYGGSFLRCTQRAGYVFKPLSFNPDATYKISGRLRQHSDGSGSHQVYIGLMGFGQDKTTVVDTAGGALIHPGNTHMVAAAQYELDADVPGTFTYFEGYVKGSAATGSVGPKNDVGAPGVMHEDVRYIAPCFVVNWDSIDAVCDVDSIEVELLDERNVPNGVLGFDESSKANALGLAIFQSQFGLAENVLVMTEDITMLDVVTDADGNLEALGMALQLLDPGGDDRVVTLPAAIAQPITFQFYNNGGEIIVIRASGSATQVVHTLGPNEWVQIQSRTAVPNLNSEWRVLAKSQQQVVLEVGSGDWQVPQGVSVVEVTMCAGGGGGGSGTPLIGGGGGAGGAYREKQVLLVIPGTSIAYTVAAGGDGGAAGDNFGSVGENTTFAGVDDVEGGNGGLASTGPSNATGGDTFFVSAGGQGGIGGVVAANSSIGGSGPYALPGGGAPAFYKGGSGGGSLSAGADMGEVDAAGPDATGFGAGGGGAGRNAGAAPAGGDGADGTIILRF